MTRFRSLEFPLLLAATALFMAAGCGTDNGETPTKCGDNVDLSKLIYDVNDASPENIQVRDELVSRGCLTGPGDASSGLAGATGTGGGGGTGGSPGDSGAD